MGAPTVTGITRPGVLDMPAAEYHRDPVPGGSLSSTGVRKLLPPSCPAKFRHYLDHGQLNRPEFDFGSAAHKLILGDGPDVEPLDYDTWRGSAVNAEADDARAAGKIPLLRKDWDTVQAMAKALREHPTAAALFDPEHGRPEQSLFWQDGPTSTWCRARLDWLSERPGSRVILPDYKTTTDASPEGFAKSIENFGYHIQAAWYLDGAIELGLADLDAEFFFVAQEKKPPYLVNIIGLSLDWLRTARAKTRAAIDTYVECAATGVWPGYGDEPHYLTQPTWAAIRDEELYL